ncbi:hypothetical protein ACIGO9_17625 [Nocardia asteroides]|uniref:hypothetical protein n=1 Tax=Nocardia asteroides TaxID=1824 RepID=UPI0037C5FAB3
MATDGGYAFFRRLPDRRVDETDLAGRVLPAAQVIETSCATYHFVRQPVALGFSNGAVADDTRRSPGDGLRLTGRLRRAGASVTHHVLRTGHRITAEDAALARGWLRARRR